VTGVRSCRHLLQRRPGRPLHGLRWLFGLAHPGPGYLRVRGLELPHRRPLRCPCEWGHHAVQRAALLPNGLHQPPGAGGSVLRRPRVGPVAQLRSGIRLDVHGLLPQLRDWAHRLRGAGRRVRAHDRGAIRRRLYVGKSFPLPPFLPPCPSLPCSLSRWQPLSSSGDF
jgi:hypothetical protein